MRSKAISSLIAVLSVSSALASDADPFQTIRPCTAQLVLSRFENADQITLDMVDRIRARQILNSKTDPAETFTSRRQSYKASGVLGTGASIAFLATDADVHWVVVKRDKNPKDGFTRSNLNYQRAAVQYYSWLGLPAAKLLDFGKQGGFDFIVVEYIHGLTLEEISLFASDALYQRLKDELDATIERFGKKSWAVIPWMFLSGKPSLGRIGADLKPNNFIYGVSRQEWVLTDP